MLCPFCLKGVRFGREQREGGVMYLCPDPKCKQEVPPAYVQDYRKYPPVVVSAIGSRGHGKTVYLASLFHVLRDGELSPANYWPGFYTMALSEPDMETISGNGQMLKDGKLPAPNPMNFPRPTMIRVVGMPMQRDCTLLCYDAAGEVVKNPTRLVLYASFVQRARTAIFLISIPDLKDTEVSQAMHDLLNVYVLGMSALDAHKQGQHLVVVYSKADEIGFTKPWSDVKTYLDQGSMGELACPEGYMKRMRKVSSQLREFTSRELRASAFLNMADANFRSVTFSVISALGAQPHAGLLDVGITPKRVFDPFLWAMEKSRPSWRQTWHRWWG